MHGSLNIRKCQIQLQAIITSDLLLKHLTSYAFSEIDKIITESTKILFAWPGLNVNPQTWQDPVLGWNLVSRSVPVLTAVYLASRSSLQSHKSPNQRRTMSYINITNGHFCRKYPTCHLFDWGANPNCSESEISTSASSDLEGEFTQLYITHPYVLYNKIQCNMFYIKTV